MGLCQPRYQALGGKECAICFGEIENGTRHGQLKPCGHDAFHFVCIDKWLKNSSTCPLCRRSATTLNGKKVQSRQQAVAEDYLREVDPNEIRDVPRPEGVSAGDWKRQQEEQKRAEERERRRRQEEEKARREEARRKEVEAKRQEEADRESQFRRYERESRLAAKDWITPLRLGSEASDKLRAFVEGVRYLTLRTALLVSAEFSQELFEAMRWSLWPYSLRRASLDSLHNVPDVVWMDDVERDLDESDLMAATRRFRGIICTTTRPQMLRKSVRDLFDVKIYIPGRAPPSLRAYVSEARDVRV